MTMITGKPYTRDITLIDIINGFHAFDRTSTTTTMTKIRRARFPVECRRLARVDRGQQQTFVWKPHACRRYDYKGGFAILLTVPGRVV